MKSRERSRLARARLLTGLTQQELTDLSQISNAHIEHIERGARTISPLLAARVARLIGISPTWLVGRGDDDKPIGMDGEPYTKDSFERWKKVGIRRKERAGQWRAYLKAIIDERLSDEAWEYFEQHWKDTFLIAEDWPEDRGLRILEVIEKFPYGPQEVEKMTLEEFSKSPATPPPAATPKARRQAASAPKKK